MAIKKFQDYFATHMLQPRSMLAQIPSDFTNHFENGKIPVTERLEVYHNNIIGNITDAILAVFPTLNILLGEQFLRQTIRQFIFENPPRASLIQDNANGFDYFLAQQKFIKQYPYIPDMARFELALHSAYYAKDTAPLMPDDLSGIKPDQFYDLRIHIAPSVTLLESAYDIMQLYKYCQNPEQLEKPDFATQHKHFFLIWRQDLMCQFIPLQGDEFLFLKLLQKDNSLGKSTEETLEECENFNVGSFLEKALNLKIFGTL